MARRPTEDITKLPKWAQDRIKTLEMRLAHEREKLAQGPEDSNTFADPYADTPRPLGKDTTIQFLVEPEKPHQVEQYLKAKLQRDHHNRQYLEVYGSDIVTIECQSSNVFRVRLLDKHLR